jgi:hypothetical protein
VFQNRKIFGIFDLFQNYLIVFTEYMKKTNILINNGCPIIISAKIHPTDLLNKINKKKNREI